MRRSPHGSAANRPSRAVLPAGSSSWATTPTTTAAWSWPPRSIGSLWSSAAASTGREATVDSVNFGQADDFSLDAIERTDAGAWTRYVRGVCWALNRWRGPLASGFQASIAGDVPLGAGLSSSASLQASVAWFLIQLGLLAGRSSRDFTATTTTCSAWNWPRCCRRSENEFVGVGSGLLDQFSSLFGRADHALFLDCDTLIHDRLPLGKPAPAIVVCDSKTSRRLADGMYDQRRAEMRPRRGLSSVTRFPIAASSSSRGSRSSSSRPNGSISTRSAASVPGTS